MARAVKRKLRRLWRRERGFTLVELLVVVSFLTIIAALLIPNLMSTLQKAKQKRTMNDMTMVGKSWMSWVTDQLSSAAAGSQGTGQFDWSSMADLPYSSLFETLVPLYANKIPEEDAWNRPYDFGSKGIETAFPIAIRSRGADGSFSGDEYDSTPFIATDFNQDIVWAAGYFVRWPDGVN